MYQCPMCPRQLKNRSGLSGHLQFKHATKLQALAAAPKQLGPAPAKALEAAPSVVLPEHSIEGQERTVYMLKTDVSQLVFAAETHEMILWDIATDVDILYRAMKAEGERNKQAMELITQQMAKLQELAKSTENTDVLARGIDQLNGKIETLMTNAHPPGFCKQRSCVANCDSQLMELKANTAKQIDDRIGWIN